MSFETAQKIYNDRLEVSIATALRLFPAPEDTPTLEIPVKLPLNVIPLFQQLMAPSDLAIVSRDAFELIGALQSGSLTCVCVVGSFIRAAIIAHRLVNCLTEVLGEYALEVAQKLDDSRSQLRDLPLFGLPISLKEIFSIKGYSCHAQNSFHIDRVMTRDAFLVTCTLQSGCIPFCRTNGPQILMSGESHSPLHGFTLNPHNTALSSGGSSSGEGALISIGASKFGLGTDIGGSVREPASFCGIYSLRPTFGRLSNVGVDMMMAGNESIMSVCGPMSGDLRLIDSFMNHVGLQNVWKLDPSVDRWLWTPPSSKKKLKIGYCIDDGFVKPFPPIKRAILELVSKFQAEMDNVELVPYTPPNIRLANDLLTAFYFPDGGDRIRAHFSRFNEPITPQTQDILDSVKSHTYQELWDLHKQRDDFRLDFHTDFTQTQGLDCVIYPVANTIAPVFHSSKNLMYCGIWNLMDYPAVVVPTGSRVNDFDYDESYEFRDEFERLCWRPWVDHGSKIFENAPICVQVVAPRWQDELAIEVARLIQSAH